MPDRDKEIKCIFTKGELAMMSAGICLYANEEVDFWKTPTDYIKTILSLREKISKLIS